MEKVASLHFVVKWEDMANHICFLKGIITLAAIMAATYKDVSEKL